MWEATTVGLQRMNFVGACILEREVLAPFFFGRASALFTSLFTFSITTRGTLRVRGTVNKFRGWHENNADVTHMRKFDYYSADHTLEWQPCSLVPRPPPSFPSLAVRKSGRGPGTFPHVSDVTGRKAVERL